MEIKPVDIIGCPCEKEIGKRHLALHLSTRHENDRLANAQLIATCMFSHLEHVGAGAKGTEFNNLKQNGKEIG